MDIRVHPLMIPSYLCLSACGGEVSSVKCGVAVPE